MQEEKDLQTKILNDLRSLGKYCEAFKIIKTSDNGIPDIFFSTALTGGIFIETKRPKGEIRKLQILKIKKLTLCGCQSFSCYTWDEWWDVKKALGLLNKDEIVCAHKQRKKLLS